MHLLCFQYISLSISVLCTTAFSHFGRYTISDQIALSLTCAPYIGHSVTTVRALLPKRSRVSAVNILFILAMLVDTNRRIPKIATFKYRLFPAHTKDQFLRIKKLPHPDQGAWGPDPGRQPLMSCCRGGSRGCRGRSRSPPAGSPRLPAAAA
jgi:hypothetical protein